MKTMSPCPNLSIEDLVRLADRLRVLAHPDRLRLIETLRYRGPLTMSELAEEIGRAHAATSQHLNHLRRMGIVRARREGRCVRYSVADRRLMKLLDCLCHAEAWAGGES